MREAPTFGIEIQGVSHANNTNRFLEQSRL